MHSIEVDPPQSRLFLLSRGAAASAVLCGLLLASSDQSYATDDGEDYFAKAFETNEPITFVDTDANLRDIAWSPDGKWIAYDDLSSNMFVLNIASGVSKMISTNQQGIRDFSWSPDSRWLAFVQEAKNTMTQIIIYNVADGSSFDMLLDLVGSTWLVLLDRRWADLFRPRESQKSLPK